MTRSSIQCRHCAGMGRKRCGGCGGAGYTVKTRIEYGPYGSSSTRETYVPHVECSGTGQSLCYTCGGTGRHDTTSGPTPVPSPRRLRPAPDYMTTWRDFNRRVDDCPDLTSAEKSQSYRAMLDLVHPTKETYPKLVQLRQQWQSRWDAMGRAGIMLDASFNLIEIAVLRYTDND